MAKVIYPARLKWGLLTVVASLALVNWLLPPPLERIDVVSPVVTDKDGVWLSGFSVEDGRWRIEADLDTIDQRLVDRLIAVEDKRFWNHGGVDPIAVARAAKSWAREGEAVSGASTLTMQLVRQLEPRPRTLKSKLIESFRAAQIEMRLSKREILQAYLTHTPYGGNLEGVRAASLSYFGQEPRHLTDAQIALLIALPQAPEARRPDSKPANAKLARDKILDKLAQKGSITELQAKEGKEADIISQKLSLPENAWLTSHRLKVQGEARFQTTLNGKLQSRFETLAAQTASAQDDSVDIAILVIENSTRKIRASIGSAGRERPGGWIDMTQRTRSPGSTLKPFIYAMAFDDGVASPGSKILDAPTRFGSYQPENFTRRYHGNVTVSEALQHSLNVPAVAALEQIGDTRFLTALESAGADIAIPDTSGDTGLAIALGGVGMTAEHLGGLYSALATGGVTKPLIWREDVKFDDTEHRLMSEQSAARITKILRQAPTPPGRVPPWLSRQAPPIAYKTGTSYGFRDAWAAGYTHDWTVVIWVGRTDGAPRAGHTGRNTAAPLLYDVFASLPHQGRQFQYEKMTKAPTGLTSLKGVNNDLPVILFPPHEAELAVEGLGAEGRGVSLAARSPNKQSLSWYVDGKTLGDADRWHPPTEGFYTLSVVNADGARAVSRVKVISLN